MLSAERLFLQVVEAGSFKRAAEQLNVEPSSVSRKIAALEDRLRVKLLRRSTQRTSPTELGQLYYEGLRRIIDDQTALEQEVTTGVERLAGRLRIAAPVDFGTQFVVPVVRQMQRQAPELSVELLLGSQFENLLEKNLDVAVRIGTLADSNLIARRLAEIERVLVASPEYLRSRGTPRRVEDLEDHDFVLYSGVQGRSDIEFSDGSRYAHARIRSRFTVNSVSAVRRLVLEGAGIHLGPRWAFKDDIRGARVMQLLPDRPLKSFPVHAVYLSRSYLPFKTQEFIRLLAERLGAEA
jgi:DNA-binding transcriptional LysR family regulator